MNMIGSQTVVSFKNILYATDFSPSAAAALPYAMSIAGHYNSKLHALHVRMPSPLWFMGLEAASQMIETEQELAAKDAQYLHRMLGSVPHDVTVEEGDFWAAFENSLERGQIDLIVVGTRGRSGLAKGLLGSIAEEILRRATCPVLTVGPEARIEGAKKLKIQEVLYATDLLPESLAAAPYAISLAEEHHAILTLLSVLDGPNVGDLIRPMDYSYSQVTRLRDLVPLAVEFWCKPTYLVKEGKAADKILEVAKERHADLIVLGAKNVCGQMAAATHLSGATAHKVIIGAACPVLTVRKKRD